MHVFEPMEIQQTSSLFLTVQIQGVVASKTNVNHLVITRNMEMNLDVPEIGFVM